MLYQRFGKSYECGNCTHVYVRLLIRVLFNTSLATGRYRVLKRGSLIIFRNMVQVFAYLKIGVDIEEDRGKR